MALTLHFHPLSSFCHKVLIALYESGTPFDGQVVDFGDAAARARFLALWPMGKIPVLHDDRMGETVPETSIIIEYLDRHYPGARALLPDREDERLEARLWDRFFDLHVQVPMQKIVTDRLRAEGEHDPRGVADAEAALGTAYGVIERHMAGRSWAAGMHFSIADCAAAPALFYASIAVPIPPAYANLIGYAERLFARPSVARVIAEARPHFHLFPLKDRIPRRFLDA